MSKRAALWGVQVVMRDFAPEEDETAFGLDDPEDVRYRFSGPEPPGAAAAQPPPPGGRAT